MKCKLLGEQTSGRIYALVFDTEDEVSDGLHRFLTAERIEAAKLCGIGGFRRATLGYYDMDEKRYLPIVVDEQVEVLSFIANVATYQGKPRVHAHCIVGHREGRTTGGHFLSGTVRPTLELMVEEIVTGLRRMDRPEVGIPLLAL